MMTAPAIQTSALSKNYGKVSAVRNLDLINPVQSADLGNSLFNALSDQLGLTLQAKKVAAEVLIVDHAEKASES